jgi:hypothetical protein
MTDTLWLGILGFITTILTIVVLPIVRARQDARLKKDEREADWKRQDAIAERLAAKVNETAVHASTVREEISRKLDNVKTLVR